jgi:hypothetical protein
MRPTALQLLRCHFNAMSMFDLAMCVCEWGAGGVKTERVGVVGLVGAILKFLILSDCVVQFMKFLILNFYTGFMNLWGGGLSKPRGWGYWLVWCHFGSFLFKLFMLDL